jgi:Zn-dependent peptidase ImmA (M78 family)
MNKLTLEQIKNIKNAEKIKLKLKVSISMIPPRLKRSKRVTEEWFKRQEVKIQKEQKLKELIKNSIRHKCTEMLYNCSNKICKDVARYISSFVI